MNKVILELCNISKDYTQGNTKISILYNINLKLYSGHVVAITGASGSGKSTLLHIAGLLDKPTKGDIVMDGFSNTNITNVRDSLRLTYIGFVYQYHYLLQDFTAYENVMLPALLNNKKPMDISSKINYLFDMLDINHRKNHWPNQLSGGEQQRVAIARALINKPSLLLADEPTGNLDKNQACKVFTLLINSVKISNTAAIIVTHNNEFAKLADTVLNLENGVLYS